MGVSKKKTVSTAAVVVQQIDGIKMIRKIPGKTGKVVTVSKRFHQLDQLITIKKEFKAFKIDKVNDLVEAAEAFNNGNEFGDTTVNKLLELRRQIDATELPPIINGLKELKSKVDGVKTIKSEFEAKVKALVDDVEAISNKLLPYRNCATVGPGIRANKQKHFVKKLDDPEYDVKTDENLARIYEEELRNKSKLHLDRQIAEVKEELNKMVKEQ